LRLQPYSCWRAQLRRLVSMTLDPDAMTSRMERLAFQTRQTTGKTVKPTDRTKMGMKTIA